MLIQSFNPEPQATAFAETVAGGSGAHMANEINIAPVAARLARDNRFPANSPPHLPWSIP